MQREQNRFAHAAADFHSDQGGAPTEDLMFHVEINGRPWLVVEVAELSVESQLPYEIHFEDAQIDMLRGAPDAIHYLAQAVAAASEHEPDFV